MSSISQFLPEPKNSYTKQDARDNSPAATEPGKALVSQEAAKRNIPQYGERTGWAPKTAEDFGDGGAYPEVHMLQYPLGMGRRRGKKGNALAKQVDGEGNTSYDALARYGRRENETVHSQFKELVPLRQRKDFDDSQDAIPERPDAEAVREAAERTKLALEKKLGGRMNARPGKGIKGGGASEAPTYVRYTPNQQGPGYNSGAAQRIVRVSDMPVDPMEPPKIRLQKEAQRPASPPAPVMHSPPRKVTAEEQREWTIPPCVSNWKNIHGFTVSLDKRLATDGRGMEEISVNDNFARLSEALISAESQARKEISERSQVQQTLARKEKEEKEERLRMLAQRAREERAAAATMPQGASESSRGYEPPPMGGSPPSPSVRRAAAQDESPPASKPSPPEPRRSRPGHMAATEFFNSESASSHRSRRRSRSPEDEGVRERDEQRREKRKQHERELRLSRMGSDAKAKYLRKAESRDISEKIALGIAKPTGTRESMFDTRLFNQSSASNAALQNDEAYNLYDKPLFSSNGRSSANYRPRAVEEEQGRAGEVERMMECDRFGAQLHGLGSSERSDAKDTKHKQASRSGPVEFEKGDVFGIDAFADTARQSKNGRR
ncbi:mRNA splicing protein [Coemansia guatemalensis]|uniref:Pre-mRNA-processing protein 45 n=1 Tax=Coemansia guatemalensis TaxID=2761395 RepID=A0A9W8HSV8_9FUNG|nr:mRNA splicing protein [Coemansia guatemalensis]